MDPCDDLVDWTQTHLLRQGERWQEQTHRFEELEPIIKPLLIDLGFVNATLPHFKAYRGAIVCGALLQRVRLRLHYLIEQWEQGVRFTRLYFLGGERPLEPLYENREAFLRDEQSPLKIRKDWQEPSIFPKTECEMNQLIWEQSEIPNEMRKQVKVHFINAPMNGDQRPTTDDTIEAWLQTAPPLGGYLVVTNAPYTHRHGLIMRTMAPEYSFDTIGSAANQQEKMAIFLDELARLIFSQQ